VQGVPGTMPSTMANPSSEKLRILLLCIAAPMIICTQESGVCTDTRCGGAAKGCCEGSPALQRKDMCQGSVDCDACCGWVSVTIPEAAANWVEALKLQKQPYGNFMTETYTSDLQARLPSRFKGGTRALSADIYNLFALNRTDTTSSQGGFPLHMLEGDETYHYYAGDGPLTLFIFDFGSGTVSNVSLGAAKPMQDQPQYTIRGQTWSGALLAKGSTWALTGASTTPGFDPRDSHMAAGNATLMLEFHDRFPQYADLISRLTAF